MKTLVMKFGGASVASLDCFSTIADLIALRINAYKRVIVVVSAMGETTNQLIQMAKKIHPNPPPREYDMLVSVGERVSSALLAMALAAKGHEALSFTGSQAGIITSNHHTEAKILNVRLHRIQHLLDTGKVIIIAGFQGVSETGQITTLGRGGSDITAVALAAATGAEKVEFFKDIEGIYSIDPKKDSTATLFEKLSYSQALDIVARGEKAVLHARSILMAEKNKIPLHVRSFLLPTSPGTFIFENGISRSAIQFEEEDLVEHVSLR